MIELTIPAWVAEFDRRFAGNFVYWQELRNEIAIGDPDFNSVRIFIRDLLAARDAERDDLAAKLDAAHKELHKLRIKAGMVQP